ncbi:MAG: hypothetical protein KAS12_02710 [Candidatus Aenigmarchaeota archaeon]|nr:hypothetical protein [Candidatus Aenigmarchaeota archaeon]
MFNQTKQPILPATGNQPVPESPKEPEDIFAETEPTVAATDQPINNNLTKQSAGQAIRRQSSFSIKKIIVRLIILAVLVGLIWGGWQTYRLITANQIIKSENLKTTELTQPTVNLPVEEKQAVPIILDSDRDGLSDEEEKVMGTDPRTIDTDQDGLTDREEVEIYKTNPLNVDSDGDGYPDGMEVNAGYDPNNSSAGAKLLDLQSEIEKLK